MTVKEVAGELGVHCSLSTVRRAMRRLGYNFKREGKDLYVRERPDIIFKRTRYLIKKIHSCSDGKFITNDMCTYN